MLDADDPEEASSLTCPLTGDEMILGHDRAKVTAELSQPGHISYLYFGRGLNTATAAPYTLIACDKPHNHDRDKYDL